MSVAPSDQTFAQIAAAMDVVAARMRDFRDRMEYQSRRIEWTLNIAFADDPKQRRRLVRDRARYYRRPALIHKGGKP